MILDPVATNPDHYRPIFENARVRVLDYTDLPGDVTTPHDHPDSLMYTVSSFRRRLVADGVSRDVEMLAGGAFWLAAQRHHGENIGDTPTHVILVELKHTADGAASPEAAPLGPS